MNLSNQIKCAFSRVRADEQMKDSTRICLLKYMEKTQQKNKFHWQRFVALPICAVLICALGFGLISYNTQVCAISIDINPSIELGVNPYNRVIVAKGINGDGEKLIDSVDVNNKIYEDAVNEIVGYYETNSNNDNVIVVTVDSESDEKTEEVLEDIEKCIGNSGNGNIYYCKNNSESVENAHANGVSFGKYNAYLELKKYEPELNVDDIKGLSMKEIRDRIQKYEVSSTVSNLSSEDSLSGDRKHNYCKSDENSGEKKQKGKNGKE